MGLHEVGLAATPLKVTVPCAYVKPLPLIWTDVPTVPELGERFVILGLTVKLYELLGPDEPNPCVARTYTPPVMDGFGTGTTIAVSLQLVGVAVPPGKFTEPPTPCVAPKFVPVMVTDVPAVAGLGDIPVMAGRMVNEVEEVTVTPATVTLIPPEDVPVGTGTTIDVALQLVGVAAVPLKFIVLEPWLDPKFVPVIVTAVPTPPEVGEMAEIVGAGTIVNRELLLIAPPTSTVTLTLGVCKVDVVNPIEVFPQLDGLTPIPPN